MDKRPRIDGKERLIRNGRSKEDQHARRLCLEALEAALAAIDPTSNVRTRLRLSRGRLRVDGFSIAMPTRIRVLAVGKASARMLSGALKVLGEHVVSGILVAPKAETVRNLNGRIIAFHTGHPSPDWEGVKASRYVMKSVESMDSDELLLCLISGGASAMLPAPAAGITLADKRMITQRLIRSKASIHEVNTVRRHLSELKGGQLAEKCPAGQIISLIISDVPGNTLSDIGSGLTAPDPTTFQDAINVLREFGLWGSAPLNVKRHLNEGLFGHISETPKQGAPAFRKVHNFIIAENNTACAAARDALKRRGVHTTILTSSVNTEARTLGKLLASVAGDSEVFGRTLKRPAALVIGGETTVEVKGAGRGGRNQELPLAAMDGIAGSDGTAIATLGTDGIDGNSPAAGAIVDGESLHRASRLRLSGREFMARNDSYTFFRKLGDNVTTGATGTNVGDVCILMRVKRDSIIYQL